MIKKRFYAVKVGNVPGIYETWEECLKAIGNYKGALHKSFISHEEAQAYLLDKDIYFEKIESDILEGYVVAYTDGSFDEEKKEFSYGVVIFDDKKNKHLLCGSNKNEKYRDFNNISGEVFGIINALDWAVTNTYTKIKIYHDYIGVQKWINKEWDAKSDISKMLCYIYETKYKDILEVSFEHVKGHSNNKYNEEADELAKSAIERKRRIKITGDSWVTIEGFNDKNINDIFKVLTEDYKEIIVNFEKKASANIYKLTLLTDKLSITTYNTGKTLIQGKDTLLFQMVLTYISEKIDEEKLVPIFKDVYRSSINKAEIDTDYYALFKELPINYPKSMCTLLKQSIINLKNFIECEDYSQYIFSAYRALEGHIRYLFEESGYHITKSFSAINKDQKTDEYIISAKIAAPFKEKILRCYNLYKKHRDTCFHFGEIIGATDSTRIIKTHNEASELIKEALIMIKETI